tara:strand:+ start:220 stop:390 length:171 start_codon:yes stop_codon:yes gene_type:complete
LLESNKTSILPILSKELFNSSMFSREEILKIKYKKMRIINTGSKVMIDKLPKIKNK